MVAHLPADVVKENFSKAVQNPGALAKLQIQTVTELPERTACILITGGTSRSRYLQGEIIKMCDEAGLRDHEFIESWGLTYFHARIAEGAVYAVAHPLSVESFIARGAGFGLQMRQGSSTRRLEGLWDNAADFLFADGHSSKIISQQLNGLDKLKIICNNFFTRDPGSLQYNRCYNFMCLGRPKRGFWTFAISFYNSKDQTRLRRKANWRKK
ncbi:hypothetical protein F4782DRAFT_532654 [Xylaria castorea]|nr:hypothetical protein F4782DRAFT_532654 [Xylaria castorea]